MRSIVFWVALCALCISVSTADLIDYDLVADFDDGDTILTNIGDDNVEFELLCFFSEDGKIITSSFQEPTNTVFLANMPHEIIILTFYEDWILEPNKNLNMGAITSVTDSQGWYWRQDFSVVGGITYYKFDLVPEPASMSMLGLGALALVRRRRTA